MHKHGSGLIFMSGSKHHAVVHAHAESARSHRHVLHLSKYLTLSTHLDCATIKDGYFDNIFMYSVKHQKDY